MEWNNLGSHVMSILSTGRVSHQMNTFPKNRQNAQNKFKPMFMTKIFPLLGIALVNTLAIWITLKSSIRSEGLLQKYFIGICTRNLE